MNHTRVAIVGLLLMFLLISPLPTLAVDSVLAFHPITWKMVKKPGLSYKIPHIVSFHDKKIRALVNQTIDNQFKQFKCELDTSTPELAGREFGVTKRVQFDRLNILSIFVKWDYYCGTSYPNQGRSSMTFDLNTGKVVRFPELFADYQGQRLAILGLIFKKQIERDNNNNNSIDDGSCEHSQCFVEMMGLGPDGDEHPVDFDYTFTKSGIAVQPDFIHAYNACAERVTVPFTELRQFADPHGLLARAIENSRSR